MLTARWVALAVRACLCWCVCEQSRASISLRQCHLCYSTPPTPVFLLMMEIAEVINRLDILQKIRRAAPAPLLPAPGISATYFALCPVQQWRFTTSLPPHRAHTGLTLHKAGCNTGRLICFGISLPHLRCKLRLVSFFPSLFLNFWILKLLLRI